MELLEVYILDSNFNSLCNVDVFESFIWTDRYTGYGDFELYLSAESKALEFAVAGNLIWLKQSVQIPSFPAGSRRYMIIEQVEITTDIENGSHLKITGRSLESILDRRIIWHQTTVSGGAQSVIKKLITDQIIDPALNERKIGNFIFNDNLDGSVSGNDIEEVQYLGDNLYDVILDICTLFNLGFYVVYSESEGKYIFGLYKGVNRSYDQPNEALLEEEEKIDDWGLSSYKTGIMNQTLPTTYGNIDMDNRVLITWTQELKELYSSALSSWEYDPDIGTYDTVFGGSEALSFQGAETEIAFSPIVNTNGNFIFVSYDTLMSYIQGILDESGSVPTILSKDHTGKTVDGIYIHDVIAGIGNGTLDGNNGIDAITVGMLMHFMGYYGAIQIAEREYVEYPYVVFSPEFDNLISSDYVENSIPYRNVNLVAGEVKENTTRKFVFVDRGSTPSGLDRYEMFTDGTGKQQDYKDENDQDVHLTDAQYINVLKEYALEELGKKENDIEVNFDGEMNTLQGFTYGVDFFLGDIVQIRNEYGMETTSRVTEMIISQSTSGIEMYPKFEAIKQEET